jgi:DNA-binding protein H-NS
MTAETYVLTLLARTSPVLAEMAARNIQTVRYWLGEGRTPEWIVREIYGVGK